MKILSIETSCDETAAAIISGENNKLEVLSNIVSSQVKIHAEWGGVVPNLAAREHLKNILPVIKDALKKSKVSPKDISLIAVTAGPGLIPALLIGINSAKTLSYVLKKPLLGIHHIEGHIYANFLQNDKIKFPVLCLVVSGGHTQLILMKKHLDYKIVGETLDDAAGEAFDKVARILNLGYPGGPVISKMADLYKSKIERHKLILPRPMIKSRDLNFSFSGLKTAVLYTVKKNKKVLKNKELKSYICHEFQQAVIDVLVAKTIEAGKKFKPKTIMLAGGVSANKELRKQLGAAIKENLPYVEYQVPDIKYSMDNAAMIAVAGYFRWKKSKNKKMLQKNWERLSADANLKIS